MSSKLRKAIAVVKDQTSISLAKVSSTNSSNLDVAVLKATTHDEVIEDRHVHEVVLLTSSSPQCASACVHDLARRLSRTKNWMVALKCLTLTLKILKQGDPHFAQEVFRTMKHGATILNLSNFRDDSNSSPWDYTAFVRTFALYLEERLGCSVMGKLHEGRRHGSIRDMKPDVLLDRMDYWHRLLDRALATRPTGSSRSNRLVQSSLHYVVRESFDIYHDMSDGLTVLLENFFQLQHHPYIEAVHICIKVSRQFDELAEFYTLCKGLGIGSRSEYPSVKKISEKDLEILETFLKDDAKSPHRSNSKGEREFPIGREESMAGLDSPFQNMEEKREWESHMNSPEEDFKDVNEKNASKSSQLGDQDSFNDLLDMRTDATDTCVSSSGGREDNLLSLDSSSDVALFEDRNKQHAAEENNSCMDLVFFNDDLQQPPQQPRIQKSNPSPYSGLDLALFDDEQNMSQKQQQLRPTSPPPITTTIAGEGCWEMVLAETASDVNQVNHSRGWELSHMDDFHNYQNPFLQGGGESSPFAIPHVGSLPPPTFNAKNPDQASILPPEADPFSHLYCMASPTGTHSYDISSAKSPLAIH